MSTNPNKKPERIVVSAADLPVYCPGPDAPLWRIHPRTYIEVVKSGVARCQYCGTEYVLHEGDHPHSHEQAGIRL